jgi:hypothetical protein
MTFNTPTHTIQINPVDNTGKFTIEVSPKEPTYNGQTFDEIKRLMGPENRLPGFHRKRLVQQIF